MQAAPQPGLAALVAPALAAVLVQFVISWYSRRTKRDELADGEEKEVRAELRQDLRECVKERNRFRDRYLVEKEQRLRAEARAAQLEAIIYARGAIPPAPSPPPDGRA